MRVNVFDDRSSIVHFILGILCYFWIWIFVLFWTYEFVEHAYKRTLKQKDYYFGDIFEFMLGVAFTHIFVKILCYGGLF